MKPRTNGIRRSQKEIQGQGPSWILLAGGALLSTLSIRLGYKLKQALDTKQLDNGQNSFRGNEKSGEKKRSGACSLHTNMYSFSQDEYGCYYCLSGMSEGTVEVKRPPTGPTVKESDSSLSLVAIPAPGSNRENGVMWASSPDRLELPRKPFHHSNSSDSPCVSESGSDIFTKREVIQKLRQQLKRRDEMIMEMQDQITELQNSLNDQVTHSGFLESQLDTANQDLFESEREIQRLRKAIADHCVRDNGHQEKSGTGRHRVTEGRNGYANGFDDGDVVPELVDKGRVDDKVEVLKREVGELKEVIEGKEYLLQSYKEQKAELFSKVKGFSLEILKRSSKTWAIEWLDTLDTIWKTLEPDVESKKSAGYILPLQKGLFRFLSKCILGADPANSPNVADNGYAMLDAWLAPQIIPTQYVGVLQPLEEIFLHTFAYPFLLVSGGYKKLYEFVKNDAKETIEIGMTQFGLTQDETIHNLLFILGFNAFGGFSVFLPTLIAALGSDTTGVQEKLRKEVREVAGSGKLSFDSVKEMELVQSFVHETLRLNPPVPSQFARARKDFILYSHDSGFEVKKGELLFGYQPLAMRDPKVFEDPETFKPDRFTKEKGKELLNYLYWSNGPQTGSPATSNKQCAAKDVVVLTACLLIADIFQRYDSITASMTSITSLVKAR